jgi:predicted MPP superfamily phosphohydrolase
MRRYLNPFMILFTIFVISAYAYARYQLSPNLAVDLLLALPFLSVWLTPILFWFGERSDDRPWAHSFQAFAYLSMGWLNFIFVALIPLNLAAWLLSAAGKSESAMILDRWTMPLTFIIGTLALFLGLYRAKSGPNIREVAVPLQQIKAHSSINNLRIVQISDLHVGPTIRRAYVEKVTAKSNALSPDLVVLTGDIVDGSIKDLRFHAEPLTGLKARLGVYLILGNHDYYSGAELWVEEFKRMGIKVLLNDHVRVEKDGEEFMLAGVLDPAVRGFSPELKPDPILARGQPELSQDLFRILLAHNPKLAPEGARAGFHLQLSGHTHAGQFIPWTWVTKLVHKPHYAGLSKEGDMTVYVSAGTGSWGPPLRLGTSPELTVLTLKPL